MFHLKSSLIEKKFRHWMVPIDVLSPKSLSKKKFI